MQRVVARARTRRRAVPPASAVVPACPACSSRSLSVSVLPSALSSTSQPITDTASQRLSSWSSTIFGAKPKPSPAERLADLKATLPVELQRAVDDLLTELSFHPPAPARVWALFSQLDQQGVSHVLSARTLHQVLAGLHTVPPTSPRHPLTVERATALAQDYALKADLVLLRLKRTGSPIGVWDLTALVNQYQALGYAPGAVQTWDELRRRRLTSPALAQRLFNTMIKWINMHRRAGGRYVVRVAAAPLIDKAVAILDDLDSQAASDVTVHHFFEILIGAGASDVFAVAIKAVYGIDMSFPGVQVDATEAERAKWRSITETQVNWILRMLEEKDDQLSKMIAFVEVFDTPCAPRRPFDNFFYSTSNPDGPLFVVDPAPQKSLVNSAALACLSRKAIDLGQGHIARLYFDELWTRWIASSHYALVELEKLAGIEWVPRSQKTLAEKGVDLDADWVTESPSTSSPVTFKTPLDGPAPIVDAVLNPPSPWSPHPVLPSSNPAPSDKPSDLLAHPIYTPLLRPTPSRPYFVPSSLLARLVQGAKNNGDTHFGRYLRRRVTHTLQAMNERVDRLFALRTCFTENGDAVNLSAVQSQLSMTQLHLRQVQGMYALIKAESTVLVSHRAARRIVTHRNQLVRRLAEEGRSDKRVLLATQATLARQQRRADLSRLVFLRQKLQRLQVLGKATPSKYQYERLVQEIRGLWRKMGIVKDAGSARVPTVTTMFGKDGERNEVTRDGEVLARKSE